MHQLFKVGHNLIITIDKLPVDTASNMYYLNHSNLFAGKSETLLKSIISSKELKVKI